MKILKTIFFCVAIMLFIVSNSFSGGSIKYTSDQIKKPNTDIVSYLAITITCVADEIDGKFYLPTLNSASGISWFNLKGYKFFSISAYSTAPPSPDTKINLLMNNIKIFGKDGRTFSYIDTQQLLIFPTIITGKLSLDIEGNVVKNANIIFVLTLTIENTI